MIPIYMRTKDTVVSQPPLWEVSGYSQSWNKIMVSMSVYTIHTVNSILNVRRMRTIQQFAIQIKRLSQFLSQDDDDDDNTTTEDFTVRNTLFNSQSSWCCGRGVYREAAANIYEANIQNKS